MKRVFVGMSGGVDSSVAAFRLLQAGYDVTGVFMKNWEDDDESGQCSAALDLDDAQSVCLKLGIPLKTVNFSEDYLERVFAHFIDAYAQGLTPNPDILCNQEIKFKAFLDYCLACGADAIATGHYASIRQREDGAFQLIQSLDTQKDQTYFLHRLSQRALSRSIFPIGQLQKETVRQIAQEIGLKNHNKKDSTGICFIGERKFRTFLSEYLPAQPGFIENTEGQVIGEHTGLMHYTLGQRQGLEIGGRRDAKPLPWFVAAKDLERNVLIAVQDTDSPLLYATSCWTDDCHWISPITENHFRCQAKVRYRQPHQACTVDINAGTVSVVFDEPQRAVTPGQSLVLYDGEVCLGGGVIKESNSPGGVWKVKSDV